MTSWTTAFKPVTKARTLDPRPQQEALGNAVLQALASKRSLIAEAKTGTGKSFAYLVPAILAAKNKQPVGEGLPPEGKRTVVSTETIALMDQLTERDLPFLHSVYGGFGYRALKGRSWYYCRNRAGIYVTSQSDFWGLMDKLREVPLERLGDGEKRDLEKVLGEEIPDDQWENFAGHMEFCADNKCTADRGCFSTRARMLAAKADIVVTTHAMLRTDADFRASGAEEGILGDYEMLVVDEAHTLERVLVDGWTTSFTGWDLYQAEIAMTSGLSIAMLDQHIQAMKDAIKDVRFAFMWSVNFFTQMDQSGSLTDFDTWKGTQFPIKQHVVYGGHDAVLVNAMRNFEEVAPERLAKAHKTLTAVSKKLEVAAEDAEYGTRKIRKGARAARKLAEFVEILRMAMLSSDAMVALNSTYYAVTATGYVGKGMREQERQLRINITPLDVSWRCDRTIWRDRVNVLVSATLADPTDNTFTFTMKSLGLGDDVDQLQTDSPFDFAGKQLIYVTPGTDGIADCYGAKYSFDELCKVLFATKGRALVLFTARSELEWAADRLGRGSDHDLGRDHKILIQTKDANKQKLADEFRSDEHSILLATKSFFTGVDFPGNTCSAVVLCKFPLPQYNALCKIQIDWWRRRGFPKWYEREALLTFSQAIGRLIRSSDDHGVVALLDQRLANPKERVAQTAEIGISATGSKVVHDLDSVSSFLVAP